ncbi:MAG: hypothetical protein E5V48_18050, partial [Mesorhizobium sp.]
MSPLARIVVPGLPHHVTQRGNGRGTVFFTPEDYALYKSLLVEHCRAADVCITNIVGASAPGSWNYVYDNA